MVTTNTVSYVVTDIVDLEQFEKNAARLDNVVILNIDDILTHSAFIEFKITNEERTGSVDWQLKKHRKELDVLACGGTSKRCETCGDTHVQNPR